MSDTEVSAARKPVDVYIKAGMAHVFVSENSSLGEQAVLQQADYEVLDGVSGSVRQMDLMTKLTLLTAHELLEKTGTKDLVNCGQREKVGLVLGSATGCLQSNEEFLGTMISKGIRFVQPVVFRNTVSNAVNGHVSVTLDIKGPNSCINQGEISGLQAMAYGYDQIMDANAKYMIVGSCDVVAQSIASHYGGVGENKVKQGASLLVLGGEENLSSDQQWRFCSYQMGYLANPVDTHKVAGILSRALDKAGLSYGSLTDILLRDAAQGWKHIGAEQCCAVQDVLATMKEQMVYGDEFNASKLSSQELLSTLIEELHAIVEKSQRTRLAVVALTAEGDCMALILEAGYE